MLLANLALNVRDLARATVGELAAHLPGAAPVLEAAPACPIGRRLHAATDGVLCRHHLEELGTWLHEIETEARRLSYDPADPDGWTAAPSAAIRYDTGGGSSAHLASQRSPGSLDVIASIDPRSTAHGRLHLGPVCNRCPTLVGRRCACPSRDRGAARRQIHWAGCPQHGLHPSCRAILADRDERSVQGARAGQIRRGDPEGERLLAVLPVLHGWAQRVRDERLLGPPVRPVVVRVPPGHEGAYTVEPDGTIGVTTLIPAPPTIRSERQILTRQLDWIAGQPWALEMRRELAELRDQLLRANGNREDQPLPGWCYRLVDGVECRGSLWPAEPLHSSGYETTDGTRAVECDQPARHHYEGGDLARLSVVVARQQRADDQADVDVPTAPAAAARVIPPAPSAANPKNAGGRLVALLAEQEEEDPAS